MCSRCYQKLIAEDADEEVACNAIPGRRFVLVVIALVFGFLATDLVFWLVLFAFGGLGATIGPAAILGLFWKRTTRAGAIAGVISGGVLIFVFKIYKAELGGMYELIPAFFGSFLVILVVSLMTKDERE